VEVSTDGIPWAWLAAFDDDVIPGAFFRVSLDSVVGHEPRQIRFRYVSRWGCYWAVDHVRIQAE
jgi:hypothetical protein